MKVYRVMTMTMSMLLGTALMPKPAEAQLLNKIKNEVKSRAENKIVREAGNATESSLDNAKNKATGAVKGNDPTEAATTSEQNGPTTNASNNNNKQASANYTSYDFVPGDKIIFQPDLTDEPDAELPARFTLVKGNAEIQSYEGEKILHLDAGSYTTVMPLMKDKNYLPEQFTVEFDMMYENDKDYFAYVNDFRVQFYDQGDDNYEGYGLYDFAIISNTRVALGKHSNSGNLENEALQKSMQINNRWHHIALYVRKNIVKAYIDQYRVIASNNMPAGAAKMAIRTDGRYGFKIKNVRLAGGGDDKYKKIVTDGKFITHGILFDVNKSSIKPESMGALNEIAKLMKDHSELNFEIDGHTDSDGNDDANLKLSQARADAVKTQLVKMGIDDKRLSTKGFGESKPIASNGDAEGKANNRRVEFVKM